MTEALHETMTCPVDDLNNLLTPNAISAWPAIGWWLLAALVLVVSVMSAWWVWRRWQRSRYRRQALSQLKQLQQHYNRLAETPENTSALVRALNILLKRVALSHFERDHVSGLTGKTWLQFLDEHGHTNGFSRGPGQVLANDVYQSALELNRQPLLDLCQAWIKKHN